MNFYKKKGSKYGNKKVTIMVDINGVETEIKFDSIKEKNRYLELRNREKMGFIAKIELQPKFILQEKYRDKDGKAVREIAYFADFTYYDKARGIDIVEDVKASATFQDPVYKLKKKILLFKYRNINFFEIYKANQ